MPTEAVDPRWHKVLSLTGHEIKNAIGVVSGYLRMVTSNRVGPLTEQQRHLLEEAEKGCGRVSALLSEIGQLSSLEEGTTTFNRAKLNLPDVLREIVDALPPAVPERGVRVELQTSNGAVTVNGDATRLKAALTSVIVAVRREVVFNDRLILREHVRRLDGQDVSWITIGTEAQVQDLSNADSSGLTRFDEWRGGVGLSLVVARRIINAHGASIWSPKEEPKKEKTEEEAEEAKKKEPKASAVIAIPVS
jgi:signal transduction histidine kinase